MLCKVHFIVVKWSITSTVMCWKAFKWQFRMINSNIFKVGYSWFINWLLSFVGYYWFLSFIFTFWKCVNTECHEYLVLIFHVENYYVYGQWPFCSFIQK